MEETANSVARSCRKRSVKRTVRLNKLSYAHLAGFMVSSPVEPCLTCITQMLLILDFMERKRGGWGLVAYQHFLCLSSTERAKDEEEGEMAIRGVVILSSWPTLAHSYSPHPLKVCLPVGLSFVFPTVLPVSPSCEVFERHSWPRIVSISAFQGWICALIVQHFLCVGNMLIFTDHHRLFVVDFVQL